MLPIEIKKDVYWVGAIDWDLRNFHGYLTQRGSTYNSYLIVDEKITLVDNVKKAFAEEQMERISKIIDLSKIDYIVQNHVEMDHSGSLSKIMKHCPNAEIIASPQGVNGLKKHYFGDWKYREVKSGETLNLGKRNLHFVQTPMVHWPDNMVSYLAEEKLLFSNDAFGQHIASTERFDDDFPTDITMLEAAKYYANIVLPYSRQVQKALEVVGTLDIEIVAPSHGLIWRKNIPQILAKYQEWSSNQIENKALIIYDTMWKSTEKIAVAIQDVFAEKNIKTKMCNLQTNHISDVMTDVLNAKYICVGSPTLNNNILPTVAAFLTYLKGLAPKNRIGLAFGSYGWGGQSIGIVENNLQDCGFEMLENIKLQYIPKIENLQTVKDGLMKEIEEKK
ncbi:MAG: FprA family A-type flavoprotein [Candidatus Cloacimonetes bacterium]|jgi:flavorubredoxin|nr:FprA family A-type flavoprotein [Candidatus Cloacimonadota bacterium]MBT6994183.1 FprA family A-type flavoprotein [Candidatus Cloacimonadota bacterium]MBT7469728.1 FprA family A-type flavoprotein [Candidatus Cloacimonadota bacterium]